MDKKHEISEHALVSLEKQTARLIEILKVAIIVLFTALLSLPLIGSLLGITHSTNAGAGWSRIWFYGILAIYGVNYWWSNVE